MRLRFKRNPEDSFFASVIQLMGARAFTMTLQVLSLPILARLLTLEDFAIVALGMVVPLFANNFSDAGFGRSLIRAPRFDQNEWSSVFWFLFVLGLGLALIVVLIAPFYAQLVGKPEVVNVVLVLATVPLMQSMMSAHQASIERDYRFDLISAVVSVAGTASTAAAVVLAYLGYGYWAVVLQQVILAGLKMAGLIWFSSFQPSFYFKPSHLKPHLRFGTNTLLLSGVMTVQNQLPVVAFNQVFGSVATSLWAMTERIARLPRLGLMGPLSQVMMVSMSRQWQEGAGAAKVAQSYIAATRLFVTLILPGMVILAFNGRPVFTWLLSEQWGDVALMFGLASPGILAHLLSGLGARVFMVADKTDLRLKMAIERFALSTVVLLVGLPFGLEVAIAAQSICFLCYLPRYWRYVGLCVPLSISAMVRLLVLPAAVGVVLAGVAAFFVVPATASATLSTVWVLGLCGVGAAVVALATRRKIVSDLDFLRASSAKLSD